MSRPKVPSRVPRANEPEAAIQKNGLMSGNWRKIEKSNHFFFLSSVAGAGWASLGTKSRIRSPPRHEIAAPMIPTREEFAESEIRPPMAGPKIIPLESAALIRPRILTLSFSSPSPEAMACPVETFAAPNPARIRERKRRRIEFATPYISIAAAEMNWQRTKTLLRPVSSAHRPHFGEATSWMRKVDWRRRPMMGPFQVTPPRKVSARSWMWGMSMVKPTMSRKIAIKSAHSAERRFFTGL